MFESVLITTSLSSVWVDLYAPFAVMAGMIYFLIAALVRSGRSRVLEESVALDNFGPPTRFRGTLTVEEDRTGNYLRLAGASKQNRRLRFYYRWVVGIGPQAIFDEVIFDRGRSSVEMKTKDKIRSLAFLELSAIRMRERAGGRSGGSIWHLELVSRNGKVIPFASSDWDDRKSGFERSAAVAKAVSEISHLPVEVKVAGNVWTHGWPPKRREIPT